MKKFCEECKNEINENFDFCPYCSLPQTETAKMLEEQKMINAQLVLIAGLVREIEDPKSLYILSNLAKKLSKR